MGSIRYKPALDGKGLLQTLQQPVECIGKLTKLVLTRARTQPMGEVIGGYLLYLPDDQGQGTEQLTCKKVADQGSKTYPQHQAEKKYLI